MKLSPAAERAGTHAVQAMLFTAASRSEALTDMTDV